MCIKNHKSKTKHLLICSIGIQCFCSISLGMDTPRPGSDDEDGLPPTPPRPPSPLDDKGLPWTPKVRSAPLSINYTTIS